jgi:hypothetical protein
MVTGSFVSAVHGVPRATHDVDVVIAPTAQQLVTLVKQFPESEYYAEIEDALESFRHGGQFNVIDQNSVWKIDFIFRKDRPFSKMEFDRRRVIEILGVSVYAATPEDLLIAKLEWAKTGESERQIRDAAGIIAIQGPALDREYVEKWVAALDLEDQWNRARTEAG